MVQLRIDGLLFSAKLIAFDKDGTLVDFHHLWGRKTALWIKAMVDTVSNDDNLQVALSNALGFSMQQNRVIADGPVAVATNAKIYAVAATVLYQHGLGWHRAERIAFESGKAIFGALPAADLVQPLGDVANTMKRLAANEIRIAIITSDEQRATETALHLLGVADYVDTIICGDDLRLPNKPDPASLHHLSQQFGIPLAQMLMVGDTESDMLFGRNANVGGCIGVIGGAGDEAALRKTADALISSIDTIQFDDDYA